MQWKLDLLLWPRDQDTEFPVEACWLYQTKEGQTEQIHQQTFDDPLFLTPLAWSTDTGFPLDKQSTRNAMLRFYGSSGRHSVGRGHHSSNRVSGISTRTMHQSTTSSLSQTIWPRWASIQFLILPIVQTLLPVTFGHSLSSEAVAMRQFGFIKLHCQNVSKQWFFIIMILYWRTLISDVLCMTSNFIWWWGSEIWEMLSTLSKQLLSDPLWSRVLRMKLNS